MRGYERARVVAFAAFDIRYESPCGVMSSAHWRVTRSIMALRIPMRGYEFLVGGVIVSCKHVTNPHAGL